MLNSHAYQFLALLALLVPGILFVGLFPSSESPICRDYIFNL